MDIRNLKEDIRTLKRETNTIILAHLYQVLDVQDVGDFIGDSLGLSRKAAEVKEADNIIFAAVDFMAEVAKLLNPAKNVLLPEPTASCPMANRLRGEEIKIAKEEHPDRPVVVYVNTLAEAKAEADTICTSANAVEICTKLARKEGTNRLLTGPDQNLAHFIRKNTGLDMVAIPEKGCCYVHDQFVIEDVNLQRQLHPEAVLVVHPECKPEVQEAADFIGSTSQMMKFVEKSSDKEFIIGTERGLVAKLERDHPGKKFHPLGVQGGICRNMKKTTLEKVHSLLVKMRDGQDVSGHEVTIDERTALGAKHAIDAMFDLMREG